MGWGWRGVIPAEKNYSAAACGGTRRSILFCNIDYYYFGSHRWASLLRGPVEDARELLRAAGNALGSVGNRVLRRRPGGAESRARPAQRGASERRAFRKGKFPTEGPRGSRPSESELAPSFGVRSRLSRAPSPQGFLSLAWLQAWSARREVQERGRPNSPRS